MKTVTIDGNTSAVQTPMRIIANERLARLDGLAREDPNDYNEKSKQNGKRDQLADQAKNQSKERHTQSSTSSCESRSFFCTIALESPCLTKNIVTKESATKIVPNAKKT